MCLEPLVYIDYEKIRCKVSERRSEIWFRKSVDFRKTTDLFIIQNNHDTKILAPGKSFL